MKEIDIWTIMIDPHDEGRFSKFKSTMIIDKEGYCYCNKSDYENGHIECRTEDLDHFSKLPCGESVGMYSTKDLTEQELNEVIDKYVDRAIQNYTDRMSYYKQLYKDAVKEKESNNNGNSI